MLMNIQVFMAHIVSCIKKKESAQSLFNSDGKIKDMMKFAAMHNPNIFRLSPLFSLTIFRKRIRDARYTRQKKYRSSFYS